MDQFQKQLLILGTPLALIFGATYLWGFWSTFDINVFEYAGLKDAALIAAIPLASLIVGIAIGTVQGMMKPAERSTTKDIQTLKLELKYYKISILLLVWLPFAIYFVGIDQLAFRWQIGWAVALTPMVVFSNYIFKELWSTARGALIFGGFSLFIAAFCIGKGNAYEIIDGWDYFASEVDGKKLKHLGHLNESHFYSDMSNEEVIILTGDAAEKTTLKRVHRKFKIKDELFK